MDTLNQIFLDALRAGLRGEMLPEQPALTGGDWQQVLAMAELHHLLPVIYEAVYTQTALKPENAPFISGIKRKVMYQVTMQTLRTSEFLALYGRLREAGVPPLVVKGIVCRNLYPNPDHRISGDEDLLVPPGRFDTCHDVLTACGLETAGAAKNAYEVSYRKPGSPIHIELHRSLFPPENEAYGDLERFFRNVHSQAEEAVFQGIPVRTMGPTDHLFYLICHAFKHFLHSGFGIRQVCDIVMYANARGGEIRWEEILTNCRAIRAEKFAAAMFRIGEAWLTFDPEKACWPRSWQEISVEIGPMLEELLQSGIYGASDMNRKHSSNITLSAVSDQKQGRKGGRGVVKSLFPPADHLQGRYPYLKKYPILLPVAWASRIVTYGRQNTGRDAGESIRIGKERIDLMKQYGILD